MQNADKGGVQKPENFAGVLYVWSLMNNAPSLAAVTELGVVLALHAHLIPADADAADEGERCRCQKKQWRRQRHLLPSSSCSSLEFLPLCHPMKAAQQEEGACI